jgi:hypothetical protein
MKNKREAKISYRKNIHKTDIKNRRKKGHGVNIKKSFQYFLLGKSS